MLILTQIKVYLYLILGIALAASYWYTFHQGGVHQAAEDAAALAKANAVYEQQINTETARRTQVETVFTQKLDALKIVNTTVNKTLKTELTNTVYTDCKVPETGVDIINDSVTKLNLTRSLVLK